MAAKSRALTKTTKDQINNTLQIVLEDGAQYITEDRARQWFGRIDERARFILRESWKELCDGKNLRHRSELLVGEVSRPVGYVLVRSDTKDDWLESL